MGLALTMTWLLVGCDPVTASAPGTASSGSDVERAADAATTTQTVVETGEPGLPVPGWLPVDDVDSVLTSGAYPGQPADGTMLWGAAVRGDDPSVHHESGDNPVLGVHRSFHRWADRTDEMVAVARNDLSNGRLPWVSIKTPSWADMAVGTHDDEIDAMLRALHGLRGPVWLTMHHEPEGGNGDNEPDDPGGPAAHVAMNRRVRARMDALAVDNVALAPILMGYTWNPESGRDPDEWWADGIYDFLGVDVYTETADPQSQFTLVEQVRSWAAERGVDLAFGEWAVDNGSPAASDLIQRWHDTAVASMTGDGARIVAMSYWDSDVRPPRGWRLQGDARDTFQSLLADPRSSHWADLAT